MQISTFEQLEHVKPAAQYSRTTAKRIKILENSVRELRKYHSKAGKKKQNIIMRLIVRYELCLSSLTLI